MIAPSRHRNGMPMNQVLGMIEAFRLAQEKCDKKKRPKKRSKKRAPKLSQPAAPRLQESDEL